MKLKESLPKGLGLMDLEQLTWLRYRTNVTSS